MQTRGKKGACLRSPLGIMTPQGVAELASSCDHPCCEIVFIQQH